MSAESIRVNLGERSYEILSAPNILLEGGARIAGAVAGRRCLVVTDSNVGPVYGTKLAKSLQVAGFDGSLAQLPPGEGTKTLKVVEFLYERCLDANLDRESCLVALGGGVIGDVTGFVAATYFRGIAFVQVPTTLLAMVDASIGGKTGVDLPRAKNAVGAFHQPRLVLIDPAVLATLPDRELKAGLAETVKYGVIDDAALFGQIEKNTAGLLAKDPETLRSVIQRCAAIKARIVSADERESSGGPRALLNLGHTFGHAIESATGYKEYLHGEAVAIGMVMAADLAVALKLLGKAERERIAAVLSNCGLPVKLHANDPDTQTLYTAMFKDKKAAAGKIRFVVADAIGRAQVVSGVPEKQVKDVLDANRE